MTSVEIAEKIQNLSPEQKPIFGRMTPQHVLEHLTITVKLSTGRIKIPEFTPSEKQLEMKRLLLDTEMEFPKGIKAPNDTGDLPELRHPNLDTAKEKLVQSLEEFEEKYKQEPDFKAIHPRFGYLNHQEWLRFHAKHFKHHLSQFGI